MKYKNIKKAKFIERPNRFIAYASLDGEQVVCHVKNTGRCRELLIPGVDVVLEKSENTERKTPFDLVAVYKNGILINMDSQAPNAVFGEWLKKTDFFGEITLIRPEFKYKNSRFDFYLEAGERKIFAEVKGVTLEEEGVVMFPDAPTERGVKHLKELCEAVAEGYEAYVFFIIQMEKCKYFTPNVRTHKEFADTLRHAAENGVTVKAVCCNVTEDSLEISDFER
jgi:sugar fermentation stimulation protein A